MCECVWLEVFIYLIAATVAAAAISTTVAYCKLYAYQNTISIVFQCLYTYTSFIFYKRNSMELNCHFTCIVNGTLNHNDNGNKIMQILGMEDEKYLHTIHENTNSFG